MKTLEEAIKARRTYYAIGNEKIVPEARIQEIVELAATHVPSSFNSQSTRMVLLLGENHNRLWQIVKDALRPLVPAEAFEATEQKIDNCFAAGYGTVLYFEDQTVVKALQEQFPSYADNFPVWSQQTSAMHQFTVWTLLEQEGLGVSLQHYNPLIDAAVAKEWNLPETWKLISQMPFGKPLAEPGEKQFKPLDEKVKVFK